MKYTLEVQFETDDLDPEESELVEDIRHEVEDVIVNYSMTSNAMCRNKGQQFLSQFITLLLCLESTSSIIGFYTIDKCVKGIIRIKYLCDQLIKLITKHRVIGIERRQQNR